MTLTRRGSQGQNRTRSLLKSIIELPDLAKTIQTLPPQTFAELVRKVGVEDTGELVALATTEQLVQAMDEDLFVNERAGERESLDIRRFIVWLEVLLEAGDERAADRVAEWDEDFLAHALGGLILVIEEDGLRERLDEGDEDEVRLVDKSLESALSEEIDGHILVAKQQEGWDAALALVLALDRNHRALLTRLLDHLARVGSHYLDDLEELSNVLSEGESLAEDVEAAREERRSKQGYVEARAAHAFLSLARKASEDPRPTERDPLTKAYFRDVEKTRSTAPFGSASHAASHALPPAVLRELDEMGSDATRSAHADGSYPSVTVDVFTNALRELGRDESTLFAERMEEFAYLVNVLVAGHDRDGVRFRPKEAVDAVVATVCFGALIEIRSCRSKGKKKMPPTSKEFVDVLRQRSADLLFRTASRALTSSSAPKGLSARETGLLYSSEELEIAIR